MTDRRVIACEAIHNFRDYGGYRSAWGGSVAMGRLFRSAHHFGATAVDLATVGAIGLAAVIDLRGPAERQAAPCPRPVGFRGLVVLDDTPAPADPPHVAAAARIRTTADAREAMALTYRTLPFTERLMQLIGRYLAVLSATDGATLIHCLAGKDRTGVAVAVAQRLLGVHGDDVMADYMLTNAAGNAEARIGSASLLIRARYGDQVSDAAIRTLMSCRPDYLDATWAEMTERFGGFEAYVAALGFDEPDRARLRERLLT